MMKFMFCLALILLPLNPSVTGVNGLLNVLTDILGGLLGCTPAPGSNPSNRKEVDVTDVKVGEMAMYAVSENNKWANTNLVYKRLVKGTVESDEGTTRYTLMILAKGGGDGMTNNYIAVVLEKQPNERLLESFEQKSWI